MYFDMMNKLALTFDSGNTYKLVTDITTRIASSAEIRKNIYLYDTYDVLDGETPEIVADKFYNDSFLHWIILITNDIIDPYEDWVKSSDSLMEYVIQKYGDSNIYHIHHYENTNGDWVMSNAPMAISISNYEYEHRLNEQKRNIKILQPVYISSFINEVENKLKQQVE